MNKRFEVASIPTKKTRKYFREPIWTQEKLLSGINKFYSKYGRAPYRSDLEKKKYNYLPHSTVCAGRLFGTWTNAIKDAGVELDKYQHRKYSRKELILLLQEYVKRTGELPYYTYSKNYSRDGMPSWYVFIRCFGSVWDAYIAAKLIKGKCVNCGFKKCTQLHHIDKNRRNNKIKNLLELCPNCHYLLHRNKLGGIYDKKV